MPQQFIRFSIVIEEMDEFIWSKVHSAIKSITLINAGVISEVNNFHQFSIYYTILNEGVKKNSSYDLVKNKYGYPISTRSKRQLTTLFTNTNTFHFIIIIKIKDEKRNFKDFVPFLSIKDEFKNVSLGLDITNNLTLTQKNSLMFSIGQVFCLLKNDLVYVNKILVFQHTIFFVIRNHPVLKSKFGAFPTPSQNKILVLKKYSPIIEINSTTFENLFHKTLNQWLEFPYKKKYDDFLFLNQFKEHFDVRTEDSLNVAHILLQRILDQLTTLHFRNNQIELLSRHLFNRSLISAYLFTILLDQLLRKTSKAKNTKSKKYLDSIKLIEPFESIDLLHGILSFTRQFSEGLREICENTLYHTGESKKGYLYFVLKHRESYDDIFNKQSKEWFKKNIFHKTYLRDQDSEFYLEITTLDSSPIGILPNYMSNCKINAKGTKQIEFEDFFIGDFSHFPDESHINLRFLAHLGLKSFAKLIKESDAFFQVESNNTNYKDFLTFFKNHKTVAEDGSEYTCTRLKNYYINGTIYNITVPVTTNIGKIQIPSASFVENKSFLELATSYISEKITAQSVYYCRNFDVYEFEAYDYKKLQDYIRKVGEKIVQEFSDSHTKYLVINYGDFILANINVSVAIKILAYLQLRQSYDKPLDYIIIINIPFDELKALLDRLNVLTNYDVFWNDKKYLYLYDTNGIPLIVTGSTAKLCNSLNRAVMFYYGQNHTLEEKNITSQNNIDPKVFNSLIPFEVLIDSHDMNGNTNTLFEQTVKNLLNESIENLLLSFKLPTTHVRLGSKIHTKNFYEAELLFQHSFFVDRFAFLLCNDLIVSLKNKQSLKVKKIVLIGYGHYSEMLINKTRDFINKSYFNEEIRISIIICKDVVDLQFDNLDDFLINTNSRIEAYYALIVPIASTLNTNYKIIHRLNKTLERNGREQLRITKDNMLLNKSIIVIRDIQENSVAVSSMECTHGWDGIDLQNKEISYSPLNNVNLSPRIKYSLLLEGQWCSPYNCEQCFPKDYTKEKVLLETNKVSVVPLNILGLPIVYKSEDDEINLLRLKELKDFLKHGHIKRGLNHYEYYIDTIKMFQLPKYDKLISLWLEDIKKVIVEDDYGQTFHCIVSTSHPTNSIFLEKVNEKIFGGNALVLRLEIHQEFRDNIVNKFNFLRKIDKRICFHFVDDSISTGTNLNLAKGYINSIFSHGIKGENKTDVVVFSSIISLLNRASYYRNEDLRNTYKSMNQNEVGDVIYSFVYVYVPSIRDPENLCFICKTKEYYLHLANTAIFEKLKAYYRDKAKKLTPTIEDQHVENMFYSSEEILTHNLDDIKTGITPHSKNIQLRKYERFELIHTIYSILNKSELNNYCKNLDDFIEQKQSFIERVNYLKVISNPLFSYYIHIREYALEKLLTEIDSLLKNHDPYKRPSLLHLNVLLCYLRQLVKLKSNYPIRLNVISQIWMFYDKLYNYFKTFLDDDIMIENIIISYETAKTKTKKNVTLTESEFKYEVLLSFKESLIGLASENKINKKLIETIVYEFSDFIQRDDYCELLRNAKKNFSEFPLELASLIKELIGEDESKSIWFDALLRMGVEWNQEVTPELLTKTITYEDNNLYKINAKLSPSISKKYKLFLNIIQNENNVVLSNCFEYYFEELQNDSELIKLFETNEIEDILNNLKSRFNKIFSSKDFVYTHLTKTIPSAHLEHIEHIFSLKTYLRHISKFTNDNILSSKRSIAIINIITKLFKEIISADAAFFLLKNVIEPEGADIYKVYEVGFDSQTQFVNEFQLDESYYSTKIISKLERDYKWYNYFSLSKDMLEYWNNSAEKKMEFNQPFILRFITNSSNGKVNPIGGITFLYKTNNYDENKSYWAELKLNLRYILFIKDDIQRFLITNFSNHNLSNYLDSRKKLLIYQTRYDKFTHGAIKHYEGLNKGIVNENMDLIKAFSLLVFTDIRIGLLFYEFLSKGNIDPSGSRDAYDINYDVFNYNREKGNELPFHQYLDSILTATKLKIKIELSPKLITHIYSEDLKLLIIEFISNHLIEYWDRNRTSDEFSIEIYNSIDLRYLILRTSGTLITQSQSYFNTLLFSSKVPQNSIGIFTINKYLTSNGFASLNVKVSEDNKSLEISIPLLKGK